VILSKVFFFFSPASFFFALPVFILFTRIFPPHRYLAFVLVRTAVCITLDAASITTFVFSFSPQALFWSPSLVFCFFSFFPLCLPVWWSRPVVSVLTPVFLLPPLCRTSPPQSEPLSSKVPGGVFFVPQHDEPLDCPPCCLFPFWAIFL